MQFLFVFGTSVIIPQGSLYLEGTYGLAGASGTINKLRQWTPSMAQRSTLLFCLLLRSLCTSDYLRYPIRRGACLTYNLVIDLNFFLYYMYMYVRKYKCFIFL